MANIDPAVQQAYDRLIDLAATVRARVGQLAAALQAAQEAGVELRESDVALLKNRFHDQLAGQLERKAGALLPPITGQINVDLSKVGAIGGEV